MRGRFPADLVDMEPSLHRHPADRRIDERVPVDNLEMTWGVPRRFGGPLRAGVLNVGRGGFLALVPRTRGLRAGAHVRIELCGGRGTVEVTYVRPSARRRWLLCGLHLVDGDIQLLDALERIVSDPTGAYARAWAGAS